MTDQLSQLANRITELQMRLDQTKPRSSAAAFIVFEIEELEDQLSKLRQKERREKWGIQ